MTETAAANTPVSNEPQRVLTIRLPKSQHALIHKAAKATGQSVNVLCREAAVSAAEAALTKAAAEGGAEAAEANGAPE